MPILTVEIVMPDGAETPDGLASALADAAGSVFGTGPGETWVRLHPLPADRYAESGGGPPPDLLPVFVTVIKARLDSTEKLEDEAAALAEAVAAVCGRPRQHVHVLYEPPAAGRIAFGGRLIRRDREAP